MLDKADGDKDQTHDADEKMPGEEEQIVSRAAHIGGKGQTPHQLGNGGACLSKQKHDTDGEELFG